MIAIAWHAVLPGAVAAGCACAYLAGRAAVFRRRRGAGICLGLHPGHPERAEVVPRRYRADLEAWQAQMWPEGEYGDLLRLWLEDGTWREKC